MACEKNELSRKEYCVMSFSCGVAKRTFFQRTITGGRIGLEMKNSPVNSSFRRLSIQSAGCPGITNVWKLSIFLILG